MSTAVELVLLQRIKVLYQEILSQRNFDNYLSREEELNSLFAQVYALNQEIVPSPERESLIQSIYEMNLDLTRFLENMKRSLDSQEKMLSSYSPTYGSVFFDKKG